MTSSVRFSLTLSAALCVLSAHGALALAADSAQRPASHPKAQAIRQALDAIKLPPGFEITLYAVVPGARHIAVAPSGSVVFVGTRGSNLWAVAPADQQDLPARTWRYAPGLQFDLPNGVCFSEDGTLYSVEFNRLRAFPEAATDYKNAEVESIVVVEQGQLIPATETQRGHGARVCRVGPDNKLYIALGQPYNVAPQQKLKLYKESGMMGIIRMDTNGENREVFATGIRNSVGMDFNPADNTLWFTDNQVDLMGDDIPPGELNRVTQQGQDFGFPNYGGGDIRTKEYKQETLPTGLVPPEVETDAHAADLGITFYKATQFPEQYRGGIFSAQHGSWNRSTPVGARIMFTRLKEDGTAHETVVFADGWLTRDQGYTGRPVDVAVLLDGSLLVSDDHAGALYRIAYREPE